MRTLVLSTVLLYGSLHILDAQPKPPPTERSSPICDSSKEQACDVFQTCGVSCDSQPSKPSLHQACGISCSSPFVEDRLRRQRQVCYCDEFCADFGDCCHDNKPMARNFTSMNRYAECLRLDYALASFGSKLISRCPEDFKNTGITSKCHYRNNDDVFQVLPVNGYLRDGRYYAFRNIYCALCHRVEVSHILQKGTFWQTSVLINDTLYNLTYEEQKQLFEFTVQNLTGTALIRKLYKSRDFQMVYKVPSLAHHCNIRVEPRSALCMKSCPSTATECLSYMYFSDYFPDTNDDVVKIQYGRCPYGGWPRLFCFDPRVLPFREFSGFSHLLDFRGMSDEFSPKISRSTVNCFANSVYDKMTKKCRPLVCPRGKFRMLDESCGNETAKISNPNIASLNRTNIANNSLDFNCPMVTYTDDEYEVKGGIAYVNSGLSFQPGDYFIQGKLLYVCNPFTNETGLRFFEYNKTQYKLTIAGNVISMCGLAVFVLTYSLFKELRTLPGQIMMNLAITLFMAQLIMLAAIDRTEIPKLCKAVAIIEHFLWLCAFFWMNSMCFSIFKTFYNIMDVRQPSPHAIIIYALYSILSPLMISSICLVLEFATDVPFQYADERRCWISGYESIMYGFAMPLAIIIFFNIILIALTVIQIVRDKRQVRKHVKNNRENNRVFLITVKLSTVMGSTWIFGYLGALTGSHLLWYLFTIFNSLQGFFIFLAYICRKPIFLKYRKFVSKKKTSSRAPSCSSGHRETSETGCSGDTNGLELKNSGASKM